MKKWTANGLFVMALCSTVDRLDRGQFSNFFPRPIAKLFAILKGKYKQFSSGWTIKRKRKKESRKKKKFTFSEFQTLTRFSSREACLVGLNLYKIGVVSLSKRKWARPLRSQILKISLKSEVSINLRIMFVKWTYWRGRGCSHIWHCAWDFRGMATVA